MSRIICNLPRSVLGWLMLDEKTLAQFRAWGAEGGRAKAKKYTKRQISNMVKRGKRKARLANGDRSRT